MKINNKSVILFLKILLLLGGVYLFLRLIISTGWRQISEAFSTNALALLLLTLVYVTYHILRTFTLKICIPYKTQFSTLFAVRLAGEAIAYIAVGSILGDTLKVALARKTVPLAEGATGVFAEKLIYHLSGAGFIIGGLFLAVFGLGASKLLIGSLTVMILIFFAMLFLLSSGIQPLARLLRRFPERRPNLRKAILKAEENLFQFRKEHPRQFFLCFSLNLASYFYSVAEILVIFYLIGYHPAFWQTWYYEAVVKTMNTANFIVPANLGIFEATNVLLAKQLEMGEQAGMIAALFVRIRAILWSIIGFLIFFYLIRKQPKTES